MMMMIKKFNASMAIVSSHCRYVYMLMIINMPLVDKNQASYVTNLQLLVCVMLSGEGQY